MAEQENRQQEQVAEAAAPQQAGQQDPVRKQGGPQGGQVSNQQQAQARPCPKDCRRCSMQQQICCASMLSFQAFDVMNGIIQRLDIQSQRITELESCIADMQPADVELSSPIPFQGDLFTGQE